MGFKDLLNVFYAGNRKKNALEEIVISAAAGSLGKEAGRRLKAQASLINRVQRLGNGKEVNFYCLRNGKPWFDDSLRFPLALPEAKLASVSLVEVKDEVLLKADLWLVDGRLFSITFNKATKGLEKKAWRPENTLVCIDPFASVERGPAPSIELVSTTFALPVSSLRPDDIKGPVLRNGMRMTPRDLGFDLPDDLSALLSMTGGFRIGTVEVFGTDSIRQVESDNGACVIIAESENGAMLGRPAGTDKREFMVFRPDADEPGILSVDFPASLEQFLKDAGNF